MERRLITGSMLHDLIRCDHRVALDVHADPAARAEPNEFIELLWEGGLEHENEIVAGLLAATPGAVDLRTAAPGSRQALTMMAMDGMAPLIVGGEIEADDLLGRPDLLRLDGDKYLPGDIKLGAAEDGQPCTPRLRYGVQIALYADVLDRLDRLSRSAGYVIDGSGARLEFSLFIDLGGTKGTLIDRYEEALELARDIVAGKASTLSVQAAECKLCR